MDLDIYGYFHFYDKINEFIHVIHKILKSDYFIGIGKFIVLHDQISTKDGRVFGKKGKTSYAFTSVYSDQSAFDKILEEGIITKDNCIGLDNVNDDEFDEFDNLKKADTLIDYGELLEYIEKNKLN